MTYKRAQAPFHMLIKPIGPLCNLRCKYCFYIDKVSMYPAGENYRMTDEMLELITRQYIESQPEGIREIQFAWQGGEPTLMGLDFFKKAVGLQKRYSRPGVRITNALQTNGTLIDDEWAKFLRDEDFLVGISLDGPEEIHDRWRRNAGGEGSFREAMRGLEAFKRYNVEFNTLSCIQRDSGDHPVEVYDFLKSAGSRFMQFIPIVERDGSGVVTEESVRPDQFGSFLKAVFDRWIRLDMGKLFVQYFEVTLAQVMGYPSSICVHSETCGRAVAVEHNGDLYSCDHYVYEERRLGNVAESPLAEMIDGRKQLDFGEEKRSGLPKSCLRCNYLRLCRGGCPKHRMDRTDEKAHGLGKDRLDEKVHRLNYLCRGYKAFYEHTLPYFSAMGNALRAGMPASEFRRFMDGGGGRREARKPGEIGRNAPCPCGSGKKYKRCCGR